MSDGRTFGGRYSLIEKVGSGGMAEVYRARDTLLDRDVAVKVLSERLSRDAAFVERFRREAQAAANINHPNIVSLYDYGSDDHASYIVMELIDGRSLADLIEENGPLMPERAAEIASDIAQALDRAHRAGIVHRDIKPGNVMITRTGETKVTDFGIARALDRNDQTVTQAGMVMGTASYLSPEQAQGDRVDARSDIYSLGCVLFELLTGRAPFSGDTPLAIAYKHVREPPTPPSRVNPEAPRALDAVVLKALAKDPDERYATAGEMHQDLQRFLHGRQVLATPPTSATTVAAAAASSTQVLQAGDGYEEDEPRRGLRNGLIALLVLVLLGLGAWFVITQLMGAQVRVPDLIGRTEREARDVLEDRGLKAEVESRPSNKPLNTVIAQDPEAGETLREGETVRLTVSGGPRKVEVPDVQDEPLERARRVLRRAGLKVGSVTEEASEAEPGTVLDQDPDAGDRVEQGSVVDLIVSSGPELVIVPFVEGQTEDDARAEIEGARLQAEVVHEPSNEVEEGRVISQDPEGGTEAEPGDVVRIVVSEGPEPQPMPDVVGEDADQAERFLEEEYGLDVTRETADEPCDGGPNTVCDQSPPPGEEVRPGDDAILFVQPEGMVSIGTRLAFAGEPGSWI